MYTVLYKNRGTIDFQYRLLYSLLHVVILCITGLFTYLITYTPIIWSAWETDSLVYTFFLFQLGLDIEATGPNYGSSQRLYFLYCRVKIIVYHRFRFRVYLFDYNERSKVVWFRNLGRWPCIIEINFFVLYRYCVTK